VEFSENDIDAFETQLTADATAQNLTFSVVTYTSIKLTADGTSSTETSWSCSDGDGSYNDTCSKLYSVLFLI
jgi:hypothetical protein